MFLKSPVHSLFKQLWLLLCYYSALFVKFLESVINLLDKHCQALFSQSSGHYWPKADYYTQTNPKQERASLPVGPGQRPTKCVCLVKSVGCVSFPQVECVSAVITHRVQKNRQAFYDYALKSYGLTWETELEGSQKQTEPGWFLTQRRVAR